MKKLSIIIAIYNVEDYLIKCLDSLFNQTIKEGYEIICVNDSSTDKSRDIILEYVKKDKRFKLLDKENGGLSDARNFGLKHIDSKYVSFIDGDDFVSKDYVEKAINKMETDDLDMLVFGYDQYYLTTNTKEKINLRMKDGIYNLKENKEILAYTPNAAWNKVYKTSLFKENDIEYPFGYRHQDLGTTPKLLLKSNRVGYLNESLYYYLIDRPNNITAQIDKKLYHIIDMSKEVMDYYKKESIFDEYVNELEYLVKRNFVQSLRKSMKLSDKKFVNKFIDDVFDVCDEYFKNSEHKYNLIEEEGDNVYLSRVKCKAYYMYKKLRG